MHAESCLTLCDPVNCSPPGSSVHGIFQARILEWVPFPFPGDLPHLGIESASTTSPSVAGIFFTIAHLGSPQYARVPYSVVTCPESHQMLPVQEMDPSDWLGPCAGSKILKQVQGI